MATGSMIEHPNFHTAASVDSPVTQVLETGVRLQLLDRQDDYWHVVLPDGRQGFVHVALVVVDPEVAFRSGTTIQEPNFHTAPNVDSPVTRVLQPGTPLLLMGQEGEYWHVRLLDGSEGFVHTALVVVAGGTGPTPAGGGGTSPAPATAGGAGVQFASANDINTWFTSVTGQDFIGWFNATQAMKGSWGGARITGAHAAEGFGKLWDRLGLVFDRPSISLEQFLSLMSVVIGETGGRVWPISELVGLPGHDGIAYAFDRIAGLKSSYNVAPNRSAGSLFNDPVFTNAFAALPLAADVTNSGDERWNGVAYPQGEFPTDVDPARTGIIMECDFYKFRGRGFIQTTWRSAYKQIVAFVQNSEDAHPVIQKYRAAWAGIDPDVVATTSTNAQWDELFQETDCIVACAGVRIHNKNSGDYLAIASDRATFAGSGPGSAWHCGLRVNGGTAYADTVKARVLQLRDALPA